MKRSEHHSQGFIKNDRWLGNARGRPAFSAAERKAVLGKQAMQLPLAVGIS